MLVDIQYERTTSTSTAARFACAATSSRCSRVRARDRSADRVLRRHVEQIKEVDPIRGKVKGRIDRYAIFPGLALRDAAGADATRHRRDPRASASARLLRQGRPLPREAAPRAATQYDTEMMEQMGSATHRELLAPSLRPKEGEPPRRSSITSEGLPSHPRRVAPDRPAARRDVSRRSRAQRDARRVRLPPPSALDNRPLKFEEFERQGAQVHLRFGDAGRVRAREERRGSSVQQVIRPTGLMDPVTEVRPVSGQQSTICSSRSAIAHEERARALHDAHEAYAEDLTDYYRELGVRIRYLHSDIDTLERIDILRDLRLGEFDVLVGINLFARASTSPRCRSFAIFDADKEASSARRARSSRPSTRGAQRERRSSCMRTRSRTR